MSSLNDVLSISSEKKLPCSTSIFILACLGSVGSGTNLAQPGWWRCFQCGGKLLQFSVRMLGTETTVFPGQFAVAEAVQQHKHQQRLLTQSQLSVLSAVVTFHCATSLVFPSIYNVISLHERTDSSILRSLSQTHPEWGYLNHLVPGTGVTIWPFTTIWKIWCYGLWGKVINVCNVCHRSKTGLSQAEKRQHPDLKNSQSGVYVKGKSVCLLLWQQV